MNDKAEKRGPSISDLESALLKHTKAISNIFDMMAAQILTMKEELDALKRPGNAVEPKPEG